MVRVLQLIMLACALWVMYDVWYVNKKLSQGAKVMWTILAAVLNVLTAVVYWVMFKSKTTSFEAGSRL